jgi:hypothetical protein
LPRGDRFLISPPLGPRVEAASRRFTVATSGAQVRRPVEQLHSRGAAIQNVKKIPSRWERLALPVAWRKNNQQPPSLSVLDVYRVPVHQFEW